MNNQICGFTVMYDLVSSPFFEFIVCGIADTFIGRFIDDVDGFGVENGIRNRLAFLGVERKADA